MVVNPSDLAELRTLGTVQGCLDRFHSANVAWPSVIISSGVLKSLVAILTYSVYFLFVFQSFQTLRQNAVQTASSRIGFCS